MAEALFHQRIPGPAFAGLVDRIVGYRENGRRLDGEIEAASLLVPLILSFGEPFHIGLGHAPTDADSYGSFTSGLFAGPVVIDSAGASECIQINFTPLGARRFFGMPMSELAGRMVKLDELADRDILHLRVRLGDERDWTRRLDLAESFVLDRLCRAPPTESAITWAVAALYEAHGDLAIGRLAKKLDWSRKHLVSQFHAAIGIGPKSFARMLRFQHAASLAAACDASGWADIAADCGYSDQAHLSRDFSALSGMSPARWRGRAA